MGQSVPEIPLSVGSKLELHVLRRAFVFAKFLYTSRPYTHTFVHVCKLLCIYVYIILHVAIYNVYTSQRRPGFCTLVPSFIIHLDLVISIVVCPSCFPAHVTQSRVERGMLVHISQFYFA